MAKPTKGDILRFLCVHAEAVTAVVIAAVAIVGLSLVALGKSFGWIFVEVDVALVAVIFLLVSSYKKWDKAMEENNRRVSETPLKEGEFFVDLTPDQYEAYVRDGYVILPDGSPVISPKYMASGKMKHVKLEDYTALNGPFRTKDNEGYDGERILDYEEKYGANHGKPVKEITDGKKR